MAETIQATKFWFMGVVFVLVWAWGCGEAQAQSAWEKIVDDGDPGYSETGPSSGRKAR